MTEKMVQIHVWIDGKALDEFDEAILTRYDDRSSAIRDLIRKFLRECNKEA